MKKLIEQYQKEIESLDKLIDFCKKRIRSIRKEFKGDLTEEYFALTETHNTTKIIAESKRQVYIQVIKDLEDYI